MNIMFIYDFNNNEYENLVSCIENKINFKSKVYKKNKITVKAKADVYVIISNDINEIEIYFKNIKEKSRVCVLTDNLSSSYIVKLIGITKNICYLKNDTDVIIKKIYSLCLESCNDND